MQQVLDWKAMQKRVEKHARDFLMEAYGFELNIPIILNGRLKSKNGCFWHKSTRKESLRIEISKTYIEHQAWETVCSTIRHECIHYFLYESDRPYKDGHPVFEGELKKWNCHSTGTISYKGRVVEYECSAEDCNTVYRKKKKYPRNGLGYTSGCCKAPIKYVGEKII